MIKKNIMFLLITITKARNTIENSFIVILTCKLSAVKCVYYAIPIQKMESITFKGNTDTSTMLIPRKKSINNFYFIMNYTKSTMINTCVTCNEEFLL